LSVSISQASPYHGTTRIAAHRRAWSDEPLARSGGYGPALADSAASLAD